MRISYKCDHNARVSFARNIKLQYFMSNFKHSDLFMSAYISKWNVRTNWQRETVFAEDHDSALNTSQVDFFRLDPDWCHGLNYCPEHVGYDCKLHFFQSIFLWAEQSQTTQLYLQLELYFPPSQWGYLLAQCILRGTPTFIFLMVLILACSASLWKLWGTSVKVKQSY